MLKPISSPTIFNLKYMLKKYINDILSSLKETDIITTANIIEEIFKSPLKEDILDSFSEDVLTNLESRGVKIKE